MKLDINDLREYFASHKDEIVADLCSLVRIPSVWAEAEGDAPYGRDCLDALKASLKLFTDEGFAGYLGEENRYALAFYGGENIAESIGLFAHTDVVPAGEGWTLTEPFSPIVSDGCVIGRGATDNKSGVILSLWVLKYFKERGITPARPITVYLGSAEEKMMTDIRVYREKHGSPYVSLVPDSGYPICYGEKGIARCWFDARDAFVDVLDMKGGKAMNVILGTAEVTLKDSDALYTELEALLKDEPNVTVKREDGKILLFAKGISTHASAPAGSRNAAFMLASLLARTQSLAASDREILSRAAGVLEPTDGSQADMAGTYGSFSPLTMANGMVCLEEGKLAFSFDIRYCPNLTPSEIEQKLTLCAEKNGFDLRLLSNRPGFLNPVDSPAVSVVLDVGEELSGTRPKPFLMGGGTYARELKNAYSIGPRAPYVKDPFVGLPGHGEPHGADEHLPIDSFLEAIVLAAESIVRLAEY